MNGLTSYILSKKYISQTISGLGAVKGAPCTIKSIEESSHGISITFEWTGSDGSKQQQTLVIPQAISILGVKINDKGHLICSMSDGSTIDAGKLPSIGEDGGDSDNEDDDLEYVKNDDIDTLF